MNRHRRTCLLRDIGAYFPLAPVVEVGFFFLFFFLNKTLNVDFQGYECCLYFTFLFYASHPTS